MRHGLMIDFKTSVQKQRGHVSHKQSCSRQSLFDVVQVNDLEVKEKKNISQSADSCQQI